MWAAYGDHRAMREVGERLRARAQQLGLSDAEVARRLGLAQSRYSNYVNGTREPDFGTFVRICIELNVTPNSILGFGTLEAEHLVGTRASIDALLTSFEQERLELALKLLSALASH